MNQDDARATAIEGMERLLAQQHGAEGAPPGRPPVVEPPTPPDAAPPAEEPEENEAGQTPEERYIIKPADTGKTLQVLLDEVVRGFATQLTDEEVETLDAYINQGWASWVRPLSKTMEVELQTPPKKIQTQSDRLVLAASQVEGGTTNIGQLRIANHALIAMHLARYGVLYLSFTEAEQAQARAMDDRGRRVRFESPLGLQNREQWVEELDCLILDRIGEMLKEFHTKMEYLLTAASLANF